MPFFSVAEREFLMEFRFFAFGALRTSSVHYSNITVTVRRDSMDGFVAPEAARALLFKLMRPILKRL